MDQGVVRRSLELARDPFPGLGGLALAEADGRDLGQRLDEMRVRRQRLLETGERLSLFLVSAGDQTGSLFSKYSSPNASCASRFPGLSSIVVVSSLNAVCR